MTRASGSVTGGNGDEVDLERLKKVQDAARSKVLALSGDHALSDDIAQEAGIRYLKRGGRTADGDKIGNPASWGNRVATNAYIDFYRREKRHQEYLKHVQEMYSLRYRALLKSDAIRDSALLDNLMIAIQNEIPDLTEREAYIGFSRGDLTGREAADMVSKRVPTFRRWVLRKHVEVALATQQMLRP